MITPIFCDSIFTAASGNLFLIFNGYDKDLSWKLPAPQATKKWQVVLSTESVKVKANGLKVPAWSVIVFKEMNKG